ncbi:MAG: YvcK family protein [Anaerolineales bacterium]|nr:YvcK family protein [Anaerolineales bacterium]
MINPKKPNKSKNGIEQVKQILRWFLPGLGVKRWFFFILLGIFLIAVGVAYVVLDFYRNAPETWWLPFLSYASLRFLPRIIRALIFGSAGLGLIFYGIYGLNRSILSPFITSKQSVVDEISNYRRKGKGPNIVVIGGGHGQATLLRGLKNFTYNLTAIVTVADDGGSSGKLRETLGILPPGDIRNCLAALSDDEDLITQLFQYRFGKNSKGLEGHSFGNLFISALADITGSFETAVAESGRALAVNGRVLPSTLHDVRLVAEKGLPHSSRAVRILGESHISEIQGKIHHVWLEPNNPPAFPNSVQKILQANMIIIGPGSLYTSIIPNLLVTDIAASIRASNALKIFVCNVATQPGESDGYSVKDHVQAITDHIGKNVFDIVVFNDNFEGELIEGVDWVKIDNDIEEHYSVYRANLNNTMQPGRHDSQKLAQAVIDLYQERTGPLVI